MNKLQKWGLTVMLLALPVIILGGYAVSEYKIDGESGFWAVTVLSIVILVVGIALFFYGGTAKPVKLGTLAGFWTAVILAFIFMLPFAVVRIDLRDYGAGLFSTSAIILITFAAVFNTVNYIMIYLDPEKRKELD